LAPQKLITSNNFIINFSHIAGIIGAARMIYGPTPAYNLEFGNKAIGKIDALKIKAAPWGVLVKCTLLDPFGRA
jgi:hypothetical protein